MPSNNEEMKYKHDFSNSLGDEVEWGEQATKFL